MQYFAAIIARNVNFCKLIFFLGIPIDKMLGNCYYYIVDWKQYQSTELQPPTIRNITMAKKNASRGLTLRSTINSRNDFAVTIQHFGCPAQARIGLFRLLGALDMMQQQMDWDDTHIGWVSAKCLVSDICCYQEKAKIVERFLNNDTIKQALRDENVEFMRDICCYAQCAGALMGNDIQDACWSFFNSLKDFIDHNWSKSNSVAFFNAID